MQNLLQKSLGLLLLTFSILTARAAQPDITGAWWNLFFEVPGKVSFSGTTLVGGDDFFIATEKTEYTATQFQNLVVMDERGTYEISTNLVVTHQTEEGDIVKFLNLAGDIMLEADGYIGDPDDEYTSLSISLRPPAALAVADLAGQWNHRYYEVGQRITAPNISPGAWLNWSGAFVEIFEGLTIEANGVVSHPDLGGAIGVITIQQGLPILFEDGEQQGFFINANKDVMLKISPDTSDDEAWQLFNVSWLVRRPDNLAVNDLVGRWHLAEIYTPQQLFVGGQPGNLSVLGGDGFAEGSFSVTFLADGRGVFIDPDSEELSEFEWTIQPGGLVHIGAGDDSFTFAINRAKDFGVATHVTEDGDVQMNLAVKYSHDPILPTAPDPKEVELVAVEKHVQHVQISANGTILRSEDPDNLNYGGPYGMSVIVEGPDLANIPAPIVTLASGSTITFAHADWFNGGRLTYRASSSEWGMGPNGDNWGAPNQQEVDMLFANGTYEVKVLSSTISLNLTGNAYPPIPLGTLTGGEWQNGVYVIDPAQTVTVTLPVFPAFSSFVDGRVAIEFDDDLLPTVERLHSDSASTTALVATIPAHTLMPGQTLALDLAYNTIVDESFVRPETFAVAAYSTYSEIIIVAPPSLRMERSGADWQIVWSGDVLESAPQVNGPWTTVTGAASPLTVPAAGAQGFYRVRVGQ